MSNENTPAAAPEVVAVIGSDFTLHWIGSGPIAPIIEAHGLKVGDKLYAAPVTAAPTLDAELAQDRMSELCELERDVLDSLPAVYYMDPPDGGSVSLGEQVKRMAEDAALWRKHSTTPAAPGIYLQAFRALACFGEEFAFSAERQPQSRVVYSQAKRLLALIDASPKGGSIAQFKGLTRELTKLSKKSEGEPVWIEPQEAAALLQPANHGAGVSG